MSAQLMKGIEGDVEERKGVGGGVVMEREVTEESVFGADAFYGDDVKFRHSCGERNWWM